jgi:glycosyltransferase involved in cell wall biosynthesis
VSKNTSIAVVVPFFKGYFFEELLNSLANQSDGDFRVFVGDDNSENPPLNLIEKYKDILQISYVRFDINLGSEDLAAQWNRCVKLAPNSDWIWVIPDDDLPSENCIEEIKKSCLIADRVRSNIIHVPCITINSRGDVLTDREDWPSITNSCDFYLRHLKGEVSGLSLANSVYRRNKFESVGGFISLPKAWGSDHATTLSVADGGSIVTAPKASLKFRMSNYNISSFIDDAEEKMQARLLFSKILSDMSRSCYSDDIRSNLLFWFYMKGELYATKFWPFSFSMMRKLLELAAVCGVDRTPIQIIKICAKGYISNLRRLLSKTK